MIFLASIILTISACWAALRIVDWHESRAITAGLSRSLDVELTAYVAALNSGRES